VTKEATVLRGSRSCPWKALKSLCNYVLSGCSQKNPFIDAAHMMNQQNRIASSKQYNQDSIQKFEPKLTNFGDLLLGTRELKATDPRGKVYSILGSAVRSQSTQIASVDYQKDVKMVYAEATVQVIESSGPGHSQPCNSGICIESSVMGSELSSPWEYTCRSIALEP
jgi:hypothetical protein